MNKDSMEIIRNTIKPTSELIEKTKKSAMNTSVRKNHIPALVAACLILAICIAAFVATVKNGTYPEITTTEGFAEEGELFYGQLVSHREQTTLKASGYQPADIAAFDESFLKDCVAIVEGNVLSVREKEYSVVYKYDKFGTNTLIQKTNTLIYEIKVEKVWYGDIEENEVILIQDELFGLNQTFCHAVGGTYVLPLCYSGEDIRTDTAGQKYLSGDTKRESPYSTVYPFHPQIEKTDRGYLFTADWKTLVTNKTKAVTVDVPLADEYYADKMRFNSADTFKRQFEKLLSDLGFMK